ncbi:tripartite tricarboxylate transporter TctB family protein [Brevibacterium atlanticum]|uniref:tripartite tricarboxylate transporter TctB family protein n=1 Tax=Brevibacterium atlanticum TaxID=2697563 RepID=UPI001D195B33|nr:tripartite tricarboxylate transporter TctB family protein [Brevibacterium atlanticum]
MNNLEDSDDPLEVQAIGDDAETPEELLALWEEEAPEPGGGIANLVACAFTLVFGIVGMVLSWNLSLGSLTDPAPGFFPFVVSLITAVLSAAQIVLGRRGGDGEKFNRYSVTVVWGVISLLVFVTALPLIGFEIPALLLAFVWMKWLGGESWRSAGLYSVLTVAAFYLIFVVALRTQLPHLF